MNPDVTRPVVDQAVEVEPLSLVLAAEKPAPGTVPSGRWAWAAALWAVPGVVVLWNVLLVTIFGVHRAWELPREALLAVAAGCLGGACFGRGQAPPTATIAAPRSAAFALGVLVAALVWAALFSTLGPPPGSAMWWTLAGEAAAVVGVGAWAGVALAPGAERRSTAWLRGLLFGAITTGALMGRIIV